jgi:putative DNA primase/helicase
MSVGYDYSPDYEDADYEFINDTINGYFKDADTARWFKKHLGSLIEGGNKEETGYFWVGNGRNGKGTIDGLLINTLGSYYYKLHNEFFTVAKKNAGGAEPEILSMKHKRLCMTHEPEGSAKYLTSKFKTNTGNDPMSARAMYSDLIEQFNPSHKTIIQTNHLPEFTDVDHGLLARLVVINFPFKFCEGDDYEKDNPNHKPIDQNLKNKLKGKENVFMNFLLNWYNVYKTEGLKDQSAEIKGAVKEYRKEVDSVKTFLEDALLKTDLESDKFLQLKCLKSTMNGLRHV